MKVDVYESPQIELWNIQCEGFMCLSSSESTNETVDENLGSWI